MQTAAPTSKDFTMSTSSYPIKKVAVIGAGLSGLVTIKELLQESHSVVCFEQDDDIGGSFNRKKNEEHGAYDDMHLTISNYFMSFSSHLPTDAKRRYWTATEYENYLHEFADKYSLKDYIHFNSKVLKVDPVDEHTWRITYEKNGTVLEECVDAVAVCSGKFRKANIPAFKGLDSFKGKVHHSINYKSPEDFSDKDVVCIGVGETGSDLVHQIAKVSRSSHLVANRPRSIIPRVILGGDTNDARTTRACHYSFLVVQSNFEATIKKRIFDNALMKKGEMNAFSMWRYLVKYGFHGEFSNKNDIFFQDIDHGRLKLHLFGVDHVYENGVVLKDGTQIPCTDIMLSTGYVTQFDLINHPAAKEVSSNVRNNQFHMIHPDLRESMVWIGFVRPDVGGVPAIAELQARYFAKLLSKKLQLPSRQVLVNEIKQLKEEEESSFCLEPDRSENTRYYHITSQLAEKLGVKARWYDLILDPLLFFYYYHGTLVASQFRLVGPDKDRKRAKAFIKKVGLVKGPIGHLLFVVSITSILSLIAPIYRRAFKLLGLENKNGYNRKRYDTVQEIMSNQWFGDRSRLIDASASLRSLFGHEYEYEGFKYFLADNYSICPSLFRDKLPSVLEINHALAGART